MMTIEGVLKLPLGHIARGLLARSWTRPFFQIGITNRNTICSSIDQSLYCGRLRIGSAGNPARNSLKHWRARLRP